MGGRTYGPQEVVPQHFAWMHRRQAFARGRIREVHMPGIEIVPRYHLSLRHLEPSFTGHRLMVIHNLGLMRAVLPPHEGDAPLAVDPDRMLPNTITA